MRRMLRFHTRMACFASLLLLPIAAVAQEQAGIAGHMTDPTGGVLPGTTVVTASPALIEQSRTAVTDGAGNYRFINLPPGTYSVTFTLDGFSTFVREGVVLTGAFVAAVDAQMSVGALQETLTVTGEAPQVDVVSTRQQTVLTAAEINVLPGASSIMTGMQYVPGVQGNQFSQGATVHGSDGADSQTHVDGIKSGMQLGSRNTFVGGIGLVTDEAQVAEIVYDTSSPGAEFAQSGIRTNMIPKSGGNNFSGDIFLDGGHENFIDSNLTPELEAEGFAFAPQAWSWSLNPSVGGPIKEDKVWFFGSYVKNRSKNFLLDSFFDPNEPSTPAGLGDDLRTFNGSDSSVQNGRITYQATPRNKLTTGFTAHQNNFDRVVGTGFGRVAPEALFSGDANPTYLTTTRWTATVSSRLLIEATVSYQRADLAFKDFEENGIGRVNISDSTTGLQSGTSFLQNFRSEEHRRHIDAAVSYVTGSHNFKAGLDWNNNVRYDQWDNNGDIFQVLTSNAFPIGVLVMPNGDLENRLHQNCDCGIYAQDAWTTDRLTLNLGVRFDWFNSTIPGGTKPAGFFSPEITSDAIEGLPSWQDWNGRFGFAYDLSGDGRTALKASAGRYVGNEGLGITEAFSPLDPRFDFRLWTDLNGDGTVINADETPQYAELAPSFNPVWGTPMTARRLDPDAPRLANWEYSAGIQHQVAEGWSVSGSWHRRRFGNFRWVDDTALDASDFRSFTFTAPTDSRLGAGSGETITGYEFADPSFVFSAGDLLHTVAEDDYRTWNGFEVILDGQLWGGGFMSSSWTAGETVNNFCTDAREEAPTGLRFCENSTGYRNLFKISASVPLPFDIQISTLFQAFPGSQILANYEINQADLRRPININLGSAATTGRVTVPLIEPGTQFDDVTTDLQLRFAKTITTGGVRTLVFMNASNIFNDLQVNTRNRFFGGGQVLNDDFFRPTLINSGRALSFGLQTSF